MSAAPPVASGLRRVLVVDDYPENLRLAMRRLEAFGFAAVGCRYPQEAWWEVESGGFDAVVVDLLYDKKPEGAAFIRRLRANSRTSAIPIVAITSWGDEHLKEARLAGADLAISTHAVLRGRLRLHALRRAGRRPTPVAVCAVLT